MRTKRTQEEIDEVLNKCADAFDFGSLFAGMSYEQGVEDAVRWLTEHDQDNPMAEYVYKEDR